MPGGPLPGLRHPGVTRFTRVLVAPPTRSPIAFASPTTTFPASMACVTTSVATRFTRAMGDARRADRFRVVALRFFRAAPRFAAAGRRVDFDALFFRADGRELERLVPPLRPADLAPRFRPVDLVLDFLGDDFRVAAISALQVRKVDPCNEDRHGKFRAREGGLAGSC